MVGRILDRKLLRDLRQNAGSLAAVVGILVAGVTVYVELGSSQRNLQQAQRHYYAQCRMAHFWVRVKKMPAAELHALRQLPGVVQLQGRIGFYATVDLPGEPEVVNALVLSLPQAADGTLNRIVLRRGGYFTPRRDNQVIVSDAFARRHRLLPGQTIHVLLGDRRQELHVVGTAISSEFVYMMGPGSITPDPEHFGVLYIKHAFAEEVFDFQGAVNEVLGRLSPRGQRHVEQLLQRIQRRLKPYGVVSTTPLRDQPSHRFLTEEIEGLETFTYIMPTMFFAVAALVLHALMSRWVQQQRVIMGTLKALGYSDRQLLLHVLKFGAAVGVVAGALGVAGGYGLSIWVTQIYATFYEFPQLRHHFYPDLAAWGFAISVLVSVLGVWQGAWQVLRLQVAEAMRPPPPPLGGAVWLERLGWLWRRLRFQWRLALRNVLRNPFRSGTVVAAALAGSALLTAGLMLHDSMWFLLDFQFRMVQRADMELTFKDHHPRRAADYIGHFPQVGYLEPVAWIPCTIAHQHRQRRITLTGVEPAALLTTPRTRDGRRAAVPRSGLLLTRKLAQILHVRPGDVVTITPTQGEQRTYQVPVARITDSYLGLNAYADRRFLDRLLGEEELVSGVQLLGTARDRSIGAIHRELKQTPGLQYISARRDMIANLQETLIRVNTIFIGLLIFFAGVIFFGGVLNTSLLNLAQRRREAATLRVLGYGPWEVGNLFLREAALLNALGTLLGLPAGYGLCHFLAWLYETEMFRLPVVFHPQVVIETLGCAFLFALVAHAVVQRLIHRMNWPEVLNVRE